MTNPTIHLNGSNPGVLVDQLEAAVTSLRRAQDALTDAAPNGRDYYPQGPQAMEDARHEHLVRQERLRVTIEGPCGSRFKTRSTTGEADED